MALLSSLISKGPLSFHFIGVNVDHQTMTEMNHVQAHKYW